MCPRNPNKQICGFNSRDVLNNIERENQYTKAKKLGLPRPKISEETRKKLSEAAKNRPRELKDKIASKISETVTKKVAAGEWHTSLAKNMHICYNGIDLHGSWELKFAKYLDANNIKWERPTKSFDYTYKAKKRKYTPDFYLPEYDEYIEIKGYETEKDHAKWEQFPEKLKILRGHDLEKLGVDL